MAASRAPLENRWDDARAAGLDEPGLLLYRSNLLGADKRITNYGGGNTSAKVTMPDPLTGEPVEVLWVKGSGGDLGSMTLDGFATLYMKKLAALKGLYRGLAHEDAMVGLLPHCTFGLNPRAASIDTPLHAYLPYRHVDHMHPDAVIAIAAAKRSRELTREVFGEEIGWLPWQRPGFDLGLKLERIARENPHYVGVVLGGHGLFTWADDARSCYETTLRIIQKAQDWLDARNTAPAFGGPAVATLPEAERRRAVLSLLPRIRGRIGKAESKVAHVDWSATVLEFVNGRRLEELAPLGTSCPDHFLRTKIRPLIVPADADDATLDRLLEAYRQDYAGYYERCRHPDSPAMRDPNPVIYLVPGVGMLSFARDKATARIAGEFYVNAINVMRGATGVDQYVGLPEQEAFDIEYWLLEEAKLQRLPKPKPLTGKVALVTGGAGGIGRTTARRLLGEGACVVVTDHDAEALAQAEAGLVQAFGRDVVAAVTGDVTREDEMAEVVAATVERFGGIDILVANAGLATAAPFAETSLADWERNSAVLAKGVFLVAREAFKVMLTQGLGGSIVTIGSKNALATSGGASAYCAAKAAALHLTRCIALEGAPYGIRANVVNPDAVLRGSRIWQGEWRHARAASYGVGDEELEEVYRQRSLLKRSVYPEDIAEAVFFFVNEATSGKSTGNILNVDAGNQIAFTR
ncbi:bifunctional rhamnulose-1-phosphate aldolase/short-chain dehydrogenase [Benzoatithermus flavus]|uniref:Bifunctional rhamnulose-1-phosphate aldolase/short-chain dehydrogenase n=1 Tax=Benzoatithermus flavus TaxID=3108223 RepID=A0ABU8XN01_9PROT